MCEKGNNDGVDNPELASALVTRLDANVRHMVSSVPFVRIGTISLTRLDAEVELTLSFASVTRLDTSVRSMVSSTTFVRIGVTLVTKLDAKVELTLSFASVTRLDA